MEAAIYPDMNGGGCHIDIVVHNSKCGKQRLQYIPTRRMVVCIIQLQQYTIVRSGGSYIMTGMVGASWTSSLWPLASIFAIPCCTQHSGSVLFQNSNSPLSMQIYAKIVGSLCLYMHICIYIHKLWYNWYEIQLLCYNPVCKITLQKKQTLQVSCGLISMAVSITLYSMSCHTRILVRHDILVYQPLIVGASILPGGS